MGHCEVFAAVFCFALIGILCTASQSKELTVETIDHTQRTIYHSPETPGYTSWIGLWQMPDGWLRCDFTQITGPKDKPVATIPVIESKDNGATWTQIADDPTEITLSDGILVANKDSNRGTAVLPDGTLVRPTTPPWDMKETGYVERSTDGGKTWSAKIYLLPAEEYRMWPTNIRRLRDGRLVLFAGVWKRSDGDLQKRMTKNMFVSSDKGKTWGEPIQLMTAEEGVCEESDFCELPNGDLFWIHRAAHFPDHETDISPLAAKMGSTPPYSYWYSDRMHGIVRKQEKTFVPGKCEPTGLPHSGYPMVMYTKEGVILHLATDGIKWTSDLGKTWTKLDIPGTPYYPKAIQLKDGRIVVVGHNGSDDKYGTVDQSIQMQVFRLKVTRK